MKRALLLSLPLLLAAAPPPARRSLEGAGRAEFERIFRGVAAASTYPDKEKLRFDYYPFDQRNQDRDGSWVDGVPKRFGSSPASAITADDVDNPTGVPIVTVTDYIFHYARDHDEAAFIIAHEFSHLQLRHVERYTADFCAAFHERFGAQAECGARKAEEERFAKADAAGFARLNMIRRSFEYLADANGLELLARAGFDPKAAESVLRGMDGLHRKHKFPPSEIHPPPLDRLATLQARIDALAAGAPRR